MATRAPCRNIQTSGSCRFGDKCRFDHSGAAETTTQADNAKSDATAPNENTGPVACRNWKSSGSCRFGDECKFSLDDSVTQGLTPYQGKRRCFGYFQCQKCEHQWKSRRSYANQAQECTKCKTPVYPHGQQALFTQRRQGPGPNGPRRPRQPQPCPKCLSLGYRCDAKEEEEDTTASAESKEQETETKTESKEDQTDGTLNTETNGKTDGKEKKKRTPRYIHGVFYPPMYPSYPQMFYPFPPVYTSPILYGPPLQTQYNAAAAAQWTNYRDPQLQQQEANVNVNGNQTYRATTAEDEDDDDVEDGYY